MVLLWPHLAKGVASGVVLGPLLWNLGPKRVYCDSPQRYRLPPEPLRKLADTEGRPGLLLCPRERWLVQLRYPGMPSIDTFPAKTLPLAGLIVDPQTRLNPELRWSTGLTLRALWDGDEPRTVDNSEVHIEGIPPNSRVTYVRWSPDGKSIVMILTHGGEPELWIVDVPEDQNAVATARPLLTNTKMHAVRGLPFKWHPHGRYLLVLCAPKGEAPAESTIPTGPIIQEAAGMDGKARTFTNLLKDEQSAQQYEYYTTCEVMVIDTITGEKRSLFAPDMYRSLSFSPDGRFILTQRTIRPFSYAVPDRYFPKVIEVTEVTEDVRPVKRFHVYDSELQENVSAVFDSTVPGFRHFAWNPSESHTLSFLEAADGGNMKNDVPHRDRLHSVGFPFQLADSQVIFQTQYRCSGVEFAEDGTLYCTERQWKDRHTRTWIQVPGEEPRKLFDRFFEDKYSSPGAPFMTRGGKFLQRDDDGNLIFHGAGYSPRGDRPFIDRVSLQGKQTRIWRCPPGPTKEGDPVEDPVFEVDGKLAPEEGRQEVFESCLALVKKEWVLLTRESPTSPPNVFLRRLSDGKETALSRYEHPQPELQGVSKELLKYNRADGVELSGYLYLPPGYDRERDGQLPCLMWAYPKEFKSKKAAGQVTGSPYSFVRGHPLTVLFYTLRGFAVMDHPSMVIVGEENVEANDTFVEQLSACADAAVEAVVKTGCVDRERIAVGGHSYGAFMSAHLVAHTNLFKAAILRSGAYNRTLTPFGFQFEERTYWEAPDVYYRMGAFTYADIIGKKKTPLLMIHGADDNNSGTYPMQSERFFTAIKGHGGIVRLIILPRESHSYRARENVMTVLAEQDDWLRRFVVEQTPTSKL